MRTPHHACPSPVDASTGGPAERAALAPVPIPEVPIPEVTNPEVAIPEVTITVCPDGPLLVRGPVSITGGDGLPVERRRRTMALCRCGATGIAPFCDGSHKVVRAGR